FPGRGLAGRQPLHLRAADVDDQERGRRGDRRVSGAVIVTPWTPSSRVQHVSTENGMRHRGEHVSRTPWRLWHLGHACSAASGSLPREPCETLRRARTHATRAVGAHVLRKALYGLSWAFAQASASSRVTKGSL